ncbi:MAG: glycosyltransferase family 2 protein [Chitinophagaceae bacterium]
MDKMPLVSIIIAAYNAGPYIAATLNSVLNQTWPNVEIIVVNDGSTDNTANILTTYEVKGIKVIHQPNSGQDIALNNGFKQAKGSFIKFMDADDLINPEMIEIQVKTLLNHPNSVAYGEWARFYNNQPEKANFTPLDYWKDASPINFLTARKEGVMLQCGIMLLPRHIIEKAGLWDERLILFNDTEFFCRQLLAAESIKFTPGARLYYRSGLQNSISVGKARKFFESTFLATTLIGQHLIARENSLRVKTLIANMFLDQYIQFYPKYADLGKQHEAAIKQWATPTIEANGGGVFKVLKSIGGWKFARYMQYIFYKLGYLNYLQWRKTRNSSSH